MNVLAVGAHHDDVELGCGGSLAKHVKHGDKVYIYTATTSGGINPFGKNIRDAEESHNDSCRAAAVLGAVLIEGDFECNNLEFNDHLNSQLIRIIEENHIDLIYTHWRYDAHHDHIALAKAVLHAGRHVDRILAYQSNWYQSDMTFKPNFYIDVSEEWDLKEAALKCYKSEMDRNNGAWIIFKKNEAFNFGRIIGVTYAEPFQCIKWRQ